MKPNQILLIALAGLGVGGVFWSLNRDKKSSGISGETGSGTSGKNVTPRNNDPDFEPSWKGDEDVDEKQHAAIDNAASGCRDGVARRLCQAQVDEGNMRQDEVAPCMAALKDHQSWQTSMGRKGWLTRGTYAYALERDCPGVVE